MRILNRIQVVLCLFATGWLTTAASSGWKAGPPPGANTGNSSGYHGTPYYGGPFWGGSYSSGGSRGSGGSFGGGK